MTDPDIVTTKRRITHPREDMDATFVLSRVAVATLEEARGVAQHEWQERIAKGRTLVALAVDEAISESGGTITLPDGTVIEVEQTTYEHLAEEAGVTWMLSAGTPPDRQRILDAFNAQEAKR